MTPHDLLALGWFLIPIKPGTKIPLDGQGLDHASNDSVVIDRWARRGCHWAVACEVSGIIALDVDPRHAGDVSWAHLCQTHGFLPAHPWQTTRGGGWHHILRDPGVELRGVLAEGVDIKRRGYILIDPSPGYALTGVEVVPPEIPEAWLAAMRKPAPSATREPRRAAGGETTPYGRSALESEIAEVYLAPRGERNNRLNAAAFAIGSLAAGGEIDLGEARPALLAAAVTAGLGEVESARTIASGLSKGQISPRSAPPRAATAPAIAIVPRTPEPSGPSVSDMPGTDIPGPQDWRRGLSTHQLADGTVSIDKTPGNLTLLLRNEPKWLDTCCYDELAHSIRWRSRPPDVPGFSTPSGMLRDSHIVYVQHAARRQWGLSWGAEAVHSAITAASESRPYHPVRQYLETLSWDGVERLTTWLDDYHQAEDIKAPVGRWWMISAVARAMTPGCQADHMMVLQGRQGCRKSTALRILSGEWYSGTLGDLRDKDAVQSLLGAWIVEIGEMDALRGAASTRVKDFISQTVDRYRPSYGRCTVERRRSCVFCGTTNEYEYLNDSTGARRFWPVSVGPLRVRELESDRDQLWAEAVVAWRAGEPWWPVEQEHVDALERAAEDRYASDPWEEPVLEWLSGPRDPEITMVQVLKAVGVDVDRSGRREAARIGAILRRAGWAQRRDKKHRFWVNVAR